MDRLVSQGEAELHHITCLRKVVSNKLSGSFQALLSSDDEINIHFHLGGILGGKEAMDKLGKVISFPVVKFKWVAHDFTDIKGWHTAEIGVSQSLTDLGIGLDRLNIFRDSFNKLPALSMKSRPFHHFGFGDEREYQRLYQQSLRHTPWKLDTFLGDSLQEDIYIKRVRSVLLAFLLGHIMPAPKEVKRKAPTEMEGVASRIMTYFRGAQA